MFLFFDVKLYLPLCFFCFVNFHSSLSQNLIKNGSFEEATINVKYGEPTEVIVPNWKMLGNYFFKKVELSEIKTINTKSFMKSLSARNGERSALIGGTIENDAHHANYIAQKLAEPLLRGYKYFISFYLRHDMRSGVCINKVGVFISDELLMPTRSMGKGQRIYNAKPQIETDTILEEWEEWTEISVEFKAKGGEQYITIGGFSPYVQMRIKEIPEYLIYERLKKYNFKARSPFTFYYYHIDDVQLQEIGLVKDIKELIDLKPGESLIFENIYFDTSSARLLADSKEGLESLLSILNENPKLAIEISGHTDNRGKADFNLQLSKKRAQAVGSYLLANGIEKNRLKPKGYGDTQPIAKNDTMLGRQRNRRVEVKVISK